MSISNGQKSTLHQNGEIKQFIRSFSDRISSSIDNDTKASLGIRPKTMLALAAGISYKKPVAVLGQYEQYTDILNTLSENLLVHPTRWHLINDALSEQELSGDVITDLSLAYHALLTEQDSNFVIIPSALQALIPDRREYANVSLQYVKGEKHSPASAVESLISIGYTRHRTTIEPGSIRVRGDIVDVWHPLWNHPTRLMFDGDNIERIQSIENQRTQEIDRITIPPVAFPAPSLALRDTLHNTLIFQSGEYTIPGSSTIHTGSASPSVLISESDEASIATYISKFEPTQTITPISQADALEFIGKLEVGKPAVHVDHGIGIFEGLQKRTIDTHEKEYLVLRYAQGDAVSVPIEFAHKVTPYLGDGAPTVHRLHGTAWKKARKAAKQDAIAFAKELLTIASTRSDSTRSRYTLLPETEHEINESFPYELTPDQKRTWNEVKHDLSQDVPMDRLIVGDVGFGKTEIAYRAARHVIASGKQVAVLAPTTLLVQQHFDVFSTRLPKSAGNVHLLSRFTTSGTKKKTEAAITDGSASIVVGTHALLSPKLDWKNLGLVIIDEEQRFGVKQKEQFKKIRANADVLSLSATPIPRTLSMALSGLRTLSLISTPPKGRKHVKTHVGRLSDEKLGEAISQEINRGGQVYIVAPKIRQLAEIRRTVEQLFPGITTEIAHGQLDDDSLSHIVHRFDSGETKILISSSIVEHGLDLPNANTMIVMHAPHFGLSDLYQLRGRIGRRQAQGYAYFFYTQHKLTSVQRQRLTALTEASRLGSGWELARRDLEIRGAGNLLGAEQSGSVNAVGVQLYLDMVREAKSGDIQDIERADITLPFTSLIPTTYIKDPEDRTSWYIRLTRAKSLQEVTERTKELEDAHGTLPTEIHNLIQSIKLQLVATNVGIQKIHTVKVTPPDEDPYDRVVVDTTNAPKVISLLSSIGNWRVRGQSLTWDTHEVTPEIVSRITQALSHDTMKA